MIFDLISNKKILYLYTYPWVVLTSDFDRQRQQNKKVYKRQRTDTNDTKIYLMGDVIEIKH